MPYRVCVYAISKNEEAFVDRWMDAVSEADLVVVLDTGSTDRTVERLRERGAVVYEQVIKPWRFDEARNRAMDRIPEDVDICVSNDLDEVFEPGWRGLLEAAWRPEHTRARYRFTWSYRPDGTPDKQFSMEKIHRRHGFRWVHPVHEVLEYGGGDPDLVAEVPGLVLHHRPDPSKSRGQYLPLLELSAAENPEDDRTAFWLGREYVYQGQYESGIRELKRHLSLPSAVWDEERCASMRYIARACRATGDGAGARAWLYRAIAECPQVREPYFDMVRLGYDEKDWMLAWYMAVRALDITRKSGSYLLEPAAWNGTLYDYAAVAAFRLGLYEEADRYVDAACAAFPQDARLEENRQLIRAAKEAQHESV